MRKQTSLQRRYTVERHDPIRQGIAVGAVPGEYDPAGIEAIYGKSSSQSTEDAFTFNHRFNVRLGVTPEWKYIGLKRIAMLAQAERAQGR